MVIFSVNKIFKNVEIKNKQLLTQNKCVCITEVFLKLNHNCILIVINYLHVNI